MADSQQFWQRVTELFEQALEQPTSARSRFLSSACAGDAELLREVNSLLAEHDAQASFLEKPAVASLEDATELLSPAVARKLPEQIGPYKIIKALGMGGMGEVYLTHDERLNRPVAVKLLLSYHSGGSDRVKRFRREALAASALNHPNILTIYEIGEDGGRNYIATEFVDGQTLQELIRGGPLTAERAIEIAIQIGSALAAAHAAGIIHRDIKPANIMVRADCLLKVLDFGVAKYSEHETRTNQSQTETEAGTVIGTAAYMSPEQARGLPLDARTDLWSAGAILYELVTGARPFQGETSLDTMAALIEKPAAPFSVYGIDAPRELERIVFKTLEKDRVRRYQNASELVAELKQLAKTLEVGGMHAPSLSASSDEVPPGTSLNSDSRESLNQPENTLAVLPFKPLTLDHRDPALELGMADTLITRLSGREIIVRPMSSVRKFVELDQDPISAGNQLQVATVLDGTIQRSGDRIRMTVRLIRATTGASLWSGTFDEDFTDIFAVQDAISEKILSALSVTISNDSKLNLKRPTENTEAYELYLRGRYHFSRLTPPEVQIGVSYFQRAIAIDPSYALAYVGLANSYRAFALTGDQLGFLSKAKEAAQEAVTLDPSLAEAHAVLGFTIFWHDWDWQTAEQEFKRALELDPNTADARWFYGTFLSSQGRFTESLSQARRARELDPLNLIQGAAEGQLLINAGLTDEAITRLQKTIELDANFWFSRVWAASAYIEKAMFAKAVAEARKAKELSGSTFANGFLGYALAKSGQKAQAEKELQDLFQLSKQRYVPPYHVALIYNGLGMRDETLAWLKRAYEERDPKMVFLGVEPKWSNLRDDPRYSELLQQIGLADKPPQRAEVAKGPPDSVLAAGASLPVSQADVARENSQNNFSSKHLSKFQKTVASLILLAVLASIGWLIYRGVTSRKLQIDSIAVMPFKNESGNTEFEYLSDGMTDTLITSLSQLPQLSVKARSSVFRYKGKDPSAQQLGNELHVQAIVVGSLKRRANDFTLHVELVDVKTETALWSNDYNRSFTSLVTLQSDIARDVSRQLRVRLSGPEEQKVVRNYTENAEAYQLYLKGRYQILKQKRSETQKGLAFFQQAIDLDPSYALAYVGLAEANRALALSGELPSVEYMPRAKDAAQKAIAIDDNLAEAHSALAFIVFWYDWDWNEAENQCKKALSLNPNSSDSHLVYAHLLSNAGRHAEALAEAKRARELDPTNLRTNALEAQFLIHAGQSDEALERLHTVFELDPNYWFAHAFAASAYIEKGMFADAIAECQKARSLSEGNGQPMGFLGYALAKSGKKAEAQAVLDELLKRANGRDVPPYWIALIYTGLGQRNDAISWLQRACDQKDPRVVFLKVEPKWQSLHDDPRFQELLRRVRFP